MRIDFKRGAFREIRTSPEVTGEIERRAQAVADACGDGYEVLPAVTPYSRARRLVAPVTKEAVRDNAVNNTLLMNVDAAR